jgi:hypothetical protein
MTYRSLKQALDSMAPEQEQLPAWDDVLDRAGVEVAPPTRRRRWKRSWVVAVAALIVVLIPLAAIGSQQNWWFLSQEGMGPKPTTDVVVVKSGTWNGNNWELVAYKSSDGEICYGIQPIHPGRSSGGGGMGCGWIEGVPRSPESKSYPPSTIMGGEAALGWGKGEQLTPYVVGAVTDKAERVEIYLRGGQVVRALTFAAPKALGSSIRFYATPFPSGVDLLPPSPGDHFLGSLEKVVGLDGEGKIVACLAACE